MNFSRMVRFSVCLIAFTFCSALFAQESGTAQSLSMEDFTETVSLWNHAVENDEYQYYLEKIISLMSSEVEKEYYPYMLSEMLFFRFFATECSSSPIFNELNKKADEFIQSLIVFEVDSPALSIAHRLFETLNRFYVKNEAFPLPEKNINEQPLELPDPVVERRMLLTAIGEAESMYIRFRTMLSNQPGNVSLRFSEEAYKRTVNNPSLLYVIKHEPTYGLLKEALDKTDISMDSLILDDDADLYYSFVKDISDAKAFFTKWGIPINSVLSEDISILLLAADTDPFLLTCLSSDVMNSTENIFSYLSLFSEMYISRINSLAYSSGK
ncbi:MAG: hypothetical protein K5930_04555 [Treponemataceae bacterium]|nr:hypothetical protein [Treponemataceae bacterium]